MKKTFDYLINEIIKTKSLSPNKYEKYSDFYNSPWRYKYFKPNKPLNFYGDYRGLHRQVTYEKGTVKVRIDLEDFRCKTSDVILIRDYISSILTDYSLSVSSNHVFIFSKDICNLKEITEESCLNSIAKQICLELERIDIVVKLFYSSHIGFPIPYET